MRGGSFDDLELTDKKNNHAQQKANPATRSWLSQKENEIKEPQERLLRQSVNRTRHVSLNKQKIESTGEAHALSKH